MLERDGLLGLRMISPQQAAHWFPQLESIGCRIDTWDIFVGEARDAGRQARGIVGEGLPTGIEVLPPLADAGSAERLRVQEFLAANGLAPFPGAMLAAGSERARTIVLGDESGQIAATGHVYFPHNTYSPYCEHAWIGLIAVAQTWRGKGLGRLTSALLVEAAFGELGARCVYAMVAPSNETSRRMVEGCGLHLAADLRCGVAVPAAAARFTR